MDDSMGEALATISKRLNWIHAEVVLKVANPVVGGSSHHIKSGTPFQAP